MSIHRAPVEAGLEGKEVAVEVVVQQPKGELVKDKLWNSSCR